MPTVRAVLHSLFLVWEEVLENVFPSKTNGVDCVLETGTQVHTYPVIDGEATLK
jgi:hypothetical protein